MCATAVEPITPKSSKPRDSTGAVLFTSAAHRLRWILFAAFAGVILLTVTMGLVQKWLWMRQLGYSGIFWTIFSVKWALFGVAAVSAFVFLWVNLRLVAKAIGDFLRDSPASKAGGTADKAAGRIDVDLSSRLFLFLMDLAAIIVSVVFAIGVSAQWDTYLRFRYGGSFGVVDPLFKVDLGFYFFRLPFYELLQGSLIFLTVAALAMVSGLALLELQQSRSNHSFKIRPNTARHLAVLLFILAMGYGRHLRSSLWAHRAYSFPSASQVTGRGNWSIRASVRLGGAGASTTGSSIRRSTERVKP